MAKRGRPRKARPKVTGAAGKMKEKLVREENKHVQFLGDLERYDRTAVGGKDPNKHYRWCSVETLGLRHQQGYVKSTDAKLKPSAPGGELFWKPEGKQSGTDSKGLVLMEMPKERRELRQDYKKAIRDERDAASLQELSKKSLKDVADSHGSTFVPEGEFLKDLGG